MLTSLSKYHPADFWDLPLFKIAGYRSCSFAHDCFNSAQSSPPGAGAPPAGKGDQRPFAVHAGENIISHSRANSPAMFSSTGSGRRTRVTASSKDAGKSKFAHLDYPPSGKHLLAINIYGKGLNIQSYKKEVVGAGKGFGHVREQLIDAGSQAAHFNKNGIWVQVLVVNEILLKNARETGATASSSYRRDKTRGL